MPGGKPNQINRRAKKPERPRGDLCKSINEGIRYFWSKRPNITPGIGRFGG